MAEKSSRRARGLVAAGAATAVLLGGVGAFALWSANLGIGGSNDKVSTGALTMTGSPTLGGWTLEQDQNASNANDPASALPSKDMGTSIDGFVATPNDVLDGVVKGAWSVTATGSDFLVDLVTNDPTLSSSAAAALNGLDTTGARKNLVITYDVSQCDGAKTGTQLAQDGITTEIKGTAGGTTISCADGQAKVKLDFSQNMTYTAASQTGALDLSKLSIDAKQVADSRGGDQLQYVNQDNPVAVPTKSN